MPVFLLEYDRKSGSLLTLRSFEDADRTLADDARLDLELRLHREEIRHEVVLLDAASETALRATHRRYFESLSELAATSGTGQR